MRLFQPCSLAIRHNLFVPPPTKDILWLRATIPAPTIPIENRKHLNCFLSLCAFSWFSPPSTYSFNLVFFIFMAPFLNFFSASHECELRNRSDLLFYLITFDVYFRSYKMPTLTFRLVNFIGYLPLKLLFVWILLRFRSCSCLEFAACFADFSWTYSSHHVRFRVRFRRCRRAYIFPCGILNKT